MAEAARQSARFLGLGVMTAAGVWFATGPVMRFSEERRVAKR